MATTTNTKYILNSATGNLLDLRLKYGATLSLDGQMATVVGGAGGDAVYASAGVSVDFSTGSGAGDALYLDGTLASYTVTSDATTVTLTKGTDTYKLNYGSTQKFVFADGSISASALQGGSTALNTAVTSLTLPTATTTATESVAFSTASVVTATAGMGKLIVNGSQGVDQVFIKSGAQADTTYLGGSTDIIWFTGKWADYTKTVTGNTITFSRAFDLLKGDGTGGTIENETIKVVGGTGILNDKLMFADGYIFSKDALTNSAAANLSAAGGKISTNAGEFTDAVKLGDVLINGTVGISADTGTGAGATDYVTSTAAQTLNGSYTGTLQDGDRIRIKLNGGAWTDATINPANHTFSLAGQTLTAGTNTVEVELLSANGVSALAGREHAVTITNGGTITLDGTAPTGTLSFIAPADAFLNAAEKANAAYTDVPVKVNLNADVQVGDVIQLELTPNAGVKANTGAPHTVTAADIKAGYYTASVPKTDLPTDGTYTVDAKLTDAAGNSSTTATVTLTVDTNGPASTVKVSTVDDAAGHAALPLANTDPYLNASENSIVFEITEDATKVWQVGDTIQIINTANGVAVGTPHTISGTDNALAAGTNKVYIRLNKSDIAGTALSEGTYQLSVRTSDAAGNTTDSLLANGVGQPLNAVVVDDTAISAKLTIASVAADGTTAPAATQSTDKFLSATETTVVVKIDSTAFGTNTALKVGDVITLQVESQTTPGSFADLSKSGGGVYTYTVTANDMADGDGAANAAYISVLKTDLTGGATNIIQAKLVDAAGNQAYGQNKLSLTVEGDVVITMDATAHDLQVTSPIVLMSSQSLATAAHKLITFTNTGNANAFAGENKANTFSVYADDTRYVSLSADGKKIIINPSWDFDFGNSYQVTVEAGAFKTAADAANGIPALSSKVVVAGDALNFSTTNLTGATSIATAVQGYVMDAATGGKTTTGAKKWFAVPANSTATYDFAGGDYAVVFKDLNAAGGDPNVNDGVAASQFAVTANNFGTGDLIYADDQNNNLAKLNDSSVTQLYDFGTELVLRFDPDTADTMSSGGTFTVKPAAGSGITASNLLQQLNIANTKTVSTNITAIERVDSTGALITGANATLLGKAITDSQPLLVKVSAAVKSGDVIQLVYIDGSNVVQNLGSAYTASSADEANGYVTLSVSRTDLGNLPQQEGYNKIFAQLTNNQSAQSYSTLLGGDDGVYLDAVAPTPTLVVKTGEDSNVTSSESGINLVVASSHLQVGDTLKLLKSDGTTLFGPISITAANVGSDQVFNITKASGNLVLGSNVFTMQSTDAAGNVGTSTITISRNEYVAYNGTVGLGPVLSGNDLKVTAYKSDGTVLGTATVATNGTFSVDVDKTYTGAVTLRVGNATAATGTADYRDESTNANKDIGGTIAAVVVADGTSQTVHITALTDLAARQLSDSSTNVVAASANQIKAYNLKLSELLGLSTTLDITNLQPTFVVDASGNATLSVAGQYGQLLAQISDQAVVKATTMANIQDQLSNAITWNWNGSAATLTPTGDLAKQVILLTKVAQAEALTTGSNASSYLTAGDLSTYGITGVSGLTADRQADLISRIVSAADDGSAYDTVAELQALANKEVALGKIQDYANSSSNPAPVLADYTAAGLTGVTASNLVAVNSKIVNSAAAGTVPSDSLLQTVVNLGISAQTTALTKIIDYANDTGTSKPAPTIANYAVAGVTGVTADNVNAVNSKVYAIVNGTLTGASTSANIQPFVDTAASAYTSAMVKIRAYIRDTAANTAPDNTTFADAGLPTLDTASEVASANYYMGNVMTAASANGTDAAILASLTAQQTALAKIDAYAQLNTNAAPTAADYVAAGITGANASNLSQLNTAVDGAATVAGASALASLLAPVFAGVPTLSSIVRAGSSVANGSFTSDAYLNAAELGAGQTAKFTVTFDRAVTGLAAGNFALKDALGNALTGATPSVTSVITADAGVGKLWTVTVSNLTGLTSKSLRLDLANNTNVKDSLSNQSLSNTVYTGGQSYTVDTSNPVTLAAAVGEDLTLSSSETSVNLYVDPANLSVGDVLKLSKADGSQVGSTVTVNSAHLSTGVTFNVLKSDLANGANTLSVNSTDIAGNAAGTASVTVTVGEYVQVTGILGLPSKVLAGNDLKVVAYDASNNVLGTGTIDATNNTYTLQLLKSATGLVKLQLTSSGSAKDFRDEATSAQADLGSMAISAAISADGTAKTANISLLTDVAARLIAGISSPTAAQISAANLAVTKLLVNSASTTAITATTPDFGITNAGTTTNTYTTSTASMYGQLLNQLSQQAQSKGRALDVVLEDLAAGISYTAGASTATLNNAFAKEVFLLAKVQMAAALSTGTTVPASVLTAQNLIDYGVTGVSGLNATRQADLLARIVATSDDGNAVDTLTELQALANKVVAIAKIQDYATLNTNPAPTVADYLAAGYSTVTTDNLTAVNAKVDAVTASDITTDALLQTVVDNGVAAYTAAVAKIAAYANLNTNPAPTVADYFNAGVTGVTAAKLTAVNAKVDAVAQTGADSRAEIQSLADAGAAAYADALSTIKNYIASGVSADIPSATTYRDAGLPAISTSAQVGNANYYLDNLFANSDNTLPDATILAKLDAQQKAIAKIDAYAALNTNAAPTVADYLAAGVSSATNASLGALNAIVDGNPGGTAPTNTIDGLKAAVSTVFALQPSVTAITTVGTSVINGAYQTDAVVNSAELAGTVNFKVTFDRDVTGVAAANFKLVDGTGVAVAGATPVYTVTTTDNKNFNVAVTGLGSMTSTTVRLDMINVTGITDVVSGQTPLTTTFSTGTTYTVDTTYNTTLVAASGQDLTLTPDETTASIFVAASKLAVGDTLTLKLATGATLATATVSAGDISAGGVTLTANKSALISPAPGALADASNAVVLTHADASGNVGVANGTLVVARTVTVSGTVGLGPVVSTEDLLVTAYDASGKVLGTSAVDGTDGTYSLNIARTYTGPLLLRLSSTGAGTDYRDEATNTNLDLGTTTISAVASADGSNKTVHITTLTDIAARLLTVSGGMIASDATTAKVDAANLLVAKKFIDTSATQAITALTPDFTITTTGAVDITATRYGQVLAQLSKQMADSGAGLAYTQATVANSLTFNYNSGTPASSTLTLGQTAADTVFLAKVAQAAALTTTATVSTMLTAADITAYGITGFSSLSAPRQTDVIARIVSGADSGAATNTVAKVQALVDQVKAIGVIQDFKNSGGTAPTADVYVTAGYPSVTTANVAAVNSAITATLADITANPDTVISAAVTSGASTQTTAFAVITAYAQTGSVVPTVQNYADAGLTGVTTANLAAVNARIDAKVATDINTVALAQAVVDAGAVAYTDAVSAIKNYVGDNVIYTAPTLAQYKDANLAGITTQTQADNANYLLSKVINGTSPTTAVLSTKLAAQITAINKINAYAVNNTATVPAVSDYTDAGFSQVTASNLAEINKRVDTAATMGKTADILSLLKAIDLKSATLDVQATDSSTLGTPTLAAGTLLFANVNATFTDDIASITIAATGSIDATKDKFAFASVSKLIDGNAQTASNVTINTVTGIDWAYNSGKKLIFTKTDGSAFTAAQAKLIEQAVKLTSAAGTTAGNKVFTLSHTDTAGVVSVSAANTITADISTDAIDLSASTANVQTTLSGYINALTAITGKSLVPAAIATPTATDIAKVSVVMGGAGFNANLAKIKLDVDQALSTDFAASNVTVGGLTGISYTYTASTQTLLLSKNDGTAFTPANIPTLVSALAFKTASATAGDRTFTLSYIDLVGNQGASGTVTLTGDMSISAPKIRLTTDDGSNTADGITTDASISVTGLDSGDTWSYSLDGGTTWTAGTGSSIAASAFGAAGSKTLQVKATDAAGNTATSSMAFTLVTGITKTTTLSSLQDNVSINGSTGSSGTPVTVASGTSTDDTTPVINGTISTALGANEVVAVYDGTTKLGNATVTTTSWTFTPGSALAAGQHSFTARIENTVTGAQGAASSASTLTIFGAEAVTYPSPIDNVGSIQAAYGQSGRYIMFRRDTTVLGDNLDIGEVQVMSNGVNVALSKSFINGPQGGHPVNTYLVDGNTSNFYASNGPSANSWVQIDLGAVYKIDSIVVTPRSGLESRLNSTQIYYSSNDMSAGAATTTANQVPNSTSFFYAATASTTTTAAQTLSGATYSSDDNTPTFNGVLPFQMASGEELAVYKTVGGTTTKMGAATVAADGLTWSYTPAALADGTYTFKAMIQPSGDTTGTAGKVVSTTTNSVVIAAAVPTQTSSISSVTDNVSINGSTGSVGTPVTIASGMSTDDTTPTISGTISATLSGSLAVGVYDNGNLLGNATVSGTNWSYTPSALTSGAHSLTARVYNTATGAQGTASSAQVVDIYTGLQASTVNEADAAGSVVRASAPAAATSTAGVIASSAVTIAASSTLRDLRDLDLTQLKFTAGGLGMPAYNSFNTSGTLTNVLTGSLAPTYASATSATIYTYGREDGGWVVMKVALTLNASTGAITAAIQSINLSYSGIDLTGSSWGVATSATTASAFGIQAASLTVPTYFDDARPALSGTIDSGLLGAGEELAIYQTVAGVTSKLGVATVTGSTWSFKPASNLADGTYTFKAMVQPTGDSSGTAGRVVSLTSDVVGIKTTYNPTQTTTLVVKDDIGTNSSTGSAGTPVVVANGDSTDDTTPLLSGTLSAALGGSQVLAVYDGTTKLGNATVSGTSWTYNPSALTAGQHTLSARVESTQSTIVGFGTTYGTAATSVVNVYDTTPAFSVFDDRGQTQSTGAARYIMLRRDASVGTYKQFDMAEVSVMSNGVNVALNKSFTTGAQGTYGSENNLTDGTSSHYASSTAGVANAWVQIDLGAVYNIDSIVVTPRTNTATQETAIVDTKVYYSVSDMSGGVASTTAAQAPTTSAVLFASTSSTASTAAQTLYQSLPAYTDDYSPTFRGVLPQAMGAGEELALYKTTGGTTTKMGVATLGADGLTWSYTPTSISEGTYTFKAMVQPTGDSSGTLGRVVSATTTSTTLDTSITSTTATISAVKDDVSLNGSTGSASTPVTVSTGTTTDDTTPVLSGTVSVALTGTQALAIYDGTTKLGFATMSGTSWTYTPSALASGAHSFTARVESTTTGVRGTPSTTYAVNISSLGVSAYDDVGNVGALTSGASTDDRTPQFSGTLPVALGTGEELALYQTLSGTTTKMGVATVGADNLSWTFTPASNLAAGAYTFKAMVQPAGDTTGTAGKVVSGNYALTIETVAPTTTVTITGATDNVSLNGSLGSVGTPVAVASNTATDDTTPTLSGTISAALSGGQVVAIYDGVTKLGNATVTGATWSYTTSALAAGQHTLKAYVETAGGVQGPASADYVLDVYSGLTTTVTDDVGPLQQALSAGNYTDDNRPTFSGTLVGPLDATEELAVYQTLGGTTTKMGVATVSGLNWSFTPTATLVDGTYTFKAMVQPSGNTTGTAGVVVSASSGSITIDTNSPTITTTLTAIKDNVSVNGSVGSVGTPVTLTEGVSTDDNTLSLSGTTSAVLTGMETLSVYDGSTYLGQAALSGTNWSYDTGALANGVHTFSARVEHYYTKAASSWSQKTTVNVDTNLAMAVKDNVGALQGSQTSGSYSDDNTPTFSGTLDVALGTGEELAIYQTYANGVTTKLGAATVTGSDWSFTATALNAGTYTFKAMVQPTGDTTGTVGRVVSASNTITIGSTDTTFNGIVGTDPTSGLAVKALSVADGMTVDMQTYSHSEIDVLNLGAGSGAKIDLADVMQNTAGLFQSPAFANLTGAGSLKQLVVNGAAGSSVVVDNASLSASWIKSATSVTNSGHTYDVYNNTNGQAQLLIDQLVTRSGAVI